MKPLLILASASPRRKALLRQIGMRFLVKHPRVRESIPVKPVASIPEFAVSLALEKARDVKRRYPDAVILGADTVVAFGGKIYGKPESEKAAVEALSALSGKTHSVVTGIALLYGRESFTDWSESRVTFRRLSRRFIHDYVKSGDPMDKAGAYGLQGLGALCVERIEGDYFNVVGLPLLKVRMLLHKLQRGFPIRP